MEEPLKFLINGMTVDEWNEFIKAEYVTFYVSWDIPEEPKKEEEKK